MRKFLILPALLLVLILTGVACDLEEPPEGYDPAKDVQGKNWNYVTHFDIKENYCGITVSYTHLRAHET